MQLENEKQYEHELFELYRKTLSQKTIYRQLHFNLILHCFLFKVAVRNKDIIQFTLNFCEVEWINQETYILTTYAKIKKEVRDKISFEGHNEDLVLKRTNIRTRLKGELIKSGFICFSYLIIIDISYNYP